MQIAQRPRQAFEIVSIGGWRNVGIGREARETLQARSGGADQDVKHSPFRQGAKYSLRVKRTRHRYAPRPQRRDRKSTRLNSSHLVISYAVFCLKKKTTTPAAILTAPPSSVFKFFAATSYVFLIRSRASSGFDSARLILSRHCAYGSFFTSLDAI